MWPGNDKFASEAPEAPEQRRQRCVHVKLLLHVNRLIKIYVAYKTDLKLSIIMCISKFSVRLKLLEKELFQR